MVNMPKSLTASAIRETRAFSDLLMNSMRHPFDSLTDLIRLVPSLLPPHQSAFYLIECFTERVGTENTKVQGVPRIGPVLFGPLNEFCYVINEACLHFVLTEPVLCRFCEDGGD
jgi:hypothetical protein